MDTLAYPYISEEISGIAFSGSISERISIHNRVRVFGVKVSWSEGRGVGFARLDVFDDSSSYDLNFSFGIIKSMPPLVVNDLSFDFREFRFIPIESKQTTLESRAFLHDKVIEIFREKFGISLDVKFEITKSIDSDGEGGADNLGFFVHGVISRQICSHDRVVIGVPLVRWGASHWSDEESGAFVSIYFTSKNDYVLEFTYVPGDEIQPFTIDGLRFEEDGFSVSPMGAFLG